MRSPLLCCLLILAVLPGLRAQDEEAGSTTLILLGPVGEWLHPRVPDIASGEVSRLTQAYLAALTDLRASPPRSTVIASDVVTPPMGSVGTALSERTLEFIEAAGVEAALAAPSDLALGAHHVNRMAENLPVPLLGSDVSMPTLRGTETRYTALSIPLTPPASVLAELHPESVSVVVQLERELAADAEQLREAVAEVQGTPVVLTTGRDATAEEGAFRVPMPALEPHQVGLVHLRGLGGDSPTAAQEVVDLLEADFSPLLRQPGAVSIRLGQPMTEGLITGRVRQAFDFDSYETVQYPLDEYADLPETIENTTCQVVELILGDRLVKTVFQVVVNPGDDSQWSSFVYAIDARTGQASIVWVRTPIFSARPSHFPAVMERLMRADEFPSRPPEMRGALWAYRAVLDGLEAAEIFRSAAPNLP